MGKKLVLAFMGVSIVLGYSGCSFTDVNVGDAITMGQTAVDAASLSDEDVRKEATRYAEYSDSTEKIAPANSKYTKRLNKLVKKHKKVDGMDLVYKVYIDDDVNAFALADGNIRVYSGLMDLMTDEELLFVIGHEVGHVYNKHSADRMRKALLTRLARQGVQVQGGVAGQLASSELGGITEDLVNAQFSQSDEFEADEYAVIFMLDNGYDPLAGYSSMMKLSTEGESYSYFSTHPPTKERAEKIKELAGK